MDVTILLPTKNGEQYLDDVLYAIFAQSSKYKYEVIAIDSGSVDKTLGILKSYPLRFYSIAPHEFNHGVTRNLLASMSNSVAHYLVFLTQDAVPCRNWLNALIEPMEEQPNLAGTFSRHVPRFTCPMPMVRQMTMEWEQCGTPHPVTKTLVDINDFEKRKSFYCYFSNTSSALRKSVWRKIPFRRVDFGEDADWAERVLRAGYSLQYQSASRVLHSHDYSLWDQFIQNIDHSKGIKRVLGPNAVVHWSWRYFWRIWWRHTCRDIVYTSMFDMPFYQRFKLVFYSSLWELSTLGGEAMGGIIGDMPSYLIKLLSYQHRIQRGEKLSRRKSHIPQPSPYILRNYK